MRFQVRCVHLDNSEHVDRHAREKLTAAIGHFAQRIERVDLLLEDIHGPKHGSERRCVARVFIAGVGEVQVQHVDPDIYHAIDEAARRVKRAVRRRVNRRRDIAQHRALYSDRAA